MFVCCVLPDRGLCDELITRPEESYRLWRVVVCDQETSWYAEVIARAGLQSQRQKKIYKQIHIKFANLGCYITRTSMTQTYTSHLNPRVYDVNGITVR
jgi:hypothetical protein